MFWIRQALDDANYDEALRRCRLLLRWRSASVHLRLLQSNVLLLAGRAPEAEDQLRAIIAQHPDNAPACRALADVLAALDRRDQAVAMYQRALNLDASLTAIRGPLAEWALENGNAARAQELAVRKPDDSVWEQATWAAVLARLDRFAEAVAMVDRATRETMRLKSKPTQAGAYWRIGRAHLALKNDGQAMVAFENARQVDPRGYYGRMAAEALSAVSR